MGRNQAFTKIKHVTVTEQVSQQICDMIGSGQYTPGDKLPTQKQLEEMMGISRPTLREAISRLISLGIIEARQGQGYFVKELGPDINIQAPKLKYNDHKTRDLFEARLFLEAVLSQLAAVFASDEEIEELVSTYERLESGELKWTACAYGENHLHALIAKYSHNEFLSEFEYSILNHLEEYPELFLSKNNEISKGKYESVPHGRIVDAIRRRDPVAAYNESIRHILLYTDDIGLRKKYGFALYQGENPTEGQEIKKQKK